MRHMYLFCNKASYYGEEVLAAHPNPSWRTTPCLLYVTAYPIFLQLPSILEAGSPSATWGCAMLWWQGPTTHGKHIYSVIKSKIYHRRLNLSAYFSNLENLNVCSVSVLHFLQWNCKEGRYKAVTISWPSVKWGMHITWCDLLEVRTCYTLAFD
jgi:hypothetical protein